MTEAYRFSILSILLLINTLVSSGVAYFVWRHRHISGAKVVSLLMAAVALVSATYLLENAAVPIPIKVFWTKISYIGLYSCPPLLFMFITGYSGHKTWLSRRNIILVWIIPILTMLLALTNDWHHLVWTNIIPNPDSSLNLAIYQGGIWFWVGITYTYLIVGATILLFIQAIYRLRKTYRSQSIALLITLLVIMSGNILYVSGSIPIAGLDITPFTFSLGGLILTWSILRRRIINLAPIARDQVIETMTDSLLILDQRGNILDYNPAAERLISSLQFRSFQYQSKLLGMPLDEVLGMKELSDHFGSPEDYRVETVFKFDPEQRTIDLHLSPLIDRNQQVYGHTVTMRDITAFRKLVESERAARQMAEVMREIGAVLNSTLEFDLILHLILAQIKRVITFDAACIWMIEEDKIRLILTEGMPELESRVGTCFSIPGTPFERPLTEHQTVYYDNIHLTFPEFSRLSQSPFYSMLIIPLYTKERIVALLSLDSLQKNYFSQEDKETAAAFASQVALAIENAQLYSKTQRQLVEQSIVNELASNIASVVELEQLLPLVHQQIQRFLPVPMLMIVGYEAEQHQWRVLFINDVEEHEGAYTKRFGDHLGITGLILKHNLPVMANSPEEITRYHEQYHQERFGLQPLSMMGVPLVLQNKVIGAMLAQHYEKEGFFKPEDLSLFSIIGKQVALAMERVQLYEDMRKMAITDDLTGLYNYRYFNVIAEKEFERALRYQKPLSLLIIDLDRFKRVNDTYGHLAGDKVLQIFTRNIRQSLRSIDIVARYGGEEFVVIFPETGLEDARLIAKRLHTPIETTPIQVEDQIIHITASMGLATLDDQNKTFREVLNLADKALYIAKNSGRNRIVAALPKEDTFIQI